MKIKKVILQSDLPKELQSFHPVIDRDDRNTIFITKKTIKDAKIFYKKYFLSQPKIKVQCDNLLKIFDSLEIDLIIRDKGEKGIHNGLELLSSW